MTFDANLLCPGGTGKKIKHCNCRDLASDLEKIIRSIEGNQRVAALDRINRILATNANRPCLLALKSMTLLGMNDMQKYEETVTTFVKVAPSNAVAQTFAAMLEIRKQRVPEAVDHVQQALSFVQESFPGELYDAIGAVAEGLAHTNQYLAARAHLLFRAMIGRGEEEAVRPLIEITSAASVPAILKHDLMFDVAPDDVPWKDRFQAILKDGARGCWKRALEAYEKLNEEFPDQPAILRNIATARSYLGYAGVPQAWHAYAALEGVPWEDAVEAETLAQVLDFEASQKTTPFLKLTLDVTDANALSEILLSSKQVISRPAEAAQLREEDTPPPKGFFLLIDRPMPETGEGLTLATSPRARCQMLLYGKETDRNARLEVLVAQDADYDQTRASLKDIAGDLVASDGSEEVLEIVPTLRVTMFPQLQFPDDISFELRRKIAEEASREAFLEKWPALPLEELDNQSPQQVADNPTYRVRLTAALWALEQLSEVEHWGVDVNALRERLGVELRGPIELEDTTMGNLKPADWGRLTPGSLATEVLFNMYQRCAMYSFRRATYTLGCELVMREDLPEGVDKERLVGSLAQLAENSEQSLAHLQQARALAEKADRSPAPWMLNEIPLRLMRGDAVEAESLIRTIQTRHIREPGVAESLYRLLVQLGVIPPEGAAGGAPMPVEPEATETKKVWMPGDAETAPKADKESKLWIPD